MTNKDIMSIFKSRYPNIRVDDYRPLCNEFVKGKEGITIWLDNGDMLFYFPKADMKRMTDKNKEAIERLNLMQERCCNGYDAEALNRAIKALDVCDRIKAIIDSWAMTNKDIMSIFKSRYPNIRVDDYRPLCNEFVKGKEGITIWLDNGDMLFYFPKADMRGGRE